MKTKISIAALFAAGVMAAATSSAQAADLGGDCCADLEERVATLEATTARKGNRKVSLVISGQVNQALMIWDDGEESDAYVINNGNSSTRLRFKGNAKINSDWSAGYYIEVEFRSALSFRLSQTNDDGSNAGGIDIRQSNMYIKSKTLGTITWGQASPATDDLAFYGSVSGVAGAFQPDWHYGNGFSLNNNAGTSTGITINELAGTLNGIIYFDGTFRNNIIRYDSPTIAGFKLTAAWGEDDLWDVAIRTKQKIGEFTFKGAIGYMEFSDDDLNGNARGITDEKAFYASAGVIHAPTGIFANLSYRSNEYDGTTANLPESEGFHIQAGIKQRWNSLGKTAIYGAYTQVDDGFVRATTAELANNASSEINRWSVGVHQWVDAAALELYAIYDHTEAEATGYTFQDFDTFTLGGRIKF